MINDRIRKGAGIAAIALIVGGGAYMTGAKALGTCSAKAKATNAAMTASEMATCEKIHAKTMASASGGCDARATNAVMTTASSGAADDCCAAASGATTASTRGTCDTKATHTVMTSVDGADACPYMKARSAKATNATAVDCPEGEQAPCPMNGAGKGNASRKVENKKIEPKGVMASMVPPPAASK